MGEGNVESHKKGPTLLTHIPFIPCQSAPPIPEIQHFQNLTLKIQGQGHG